MPSPLPSALVAAWCLVGAAGHWYDGLESVKVFSPGDAGVQKSVDEVFKQQRDSQFNESRFALLFTRGDYKDLHVPAGFYTSIIGVGRDPSEVRLAKVSSINGAVDGATQNFWRSVEGVTLTGDASVWAVSQGAPFRRSVVQGDLYLSDRGGWSSGGFMAGVRVDGLLDMGTQQQWFFRNVDLGAKGINCPVGWNYVFVGVRGLDAEGCQGKTPAKVAEVPGTPRAAEKPYLVQEEDGETWNIYVPEFAASSSARPLAGTAPAPLAAVDRKLRLGRDVFVARPGMTPNQIEAGMENKGGLLLTPGVYDLEVPIHIRSDGFVVLGLGFPTLVAHGGCSAIEVLGGLYDVRIAGLLLEAGTAGSAGGAPPLLVWGSRPQVTGAAASRVALAVPRRRLGGGFELGRGRGGVLSDLFARVGAFRYQGCPRVSVEAMLEINSDDVVMDNAWLWQADHDDCSEARKGAPVASDSCYSTHSLVVNGDRATVYGLSAEHSVGGDVVSWRGEGGETYFYQCELPYHNPKFSRKGYSGYSVDREVIQHKALGLGIYIIGGMGVHTAYRGSPALDLQNLVTVVIGKDVKQFANSACASSAYSAQGEVCFQPEHCDEIRCVLTGLDQRRLQGMLPSPGARERLLPRFELSAKTSSQIMADSQTGANFSFFVAGAWTKAVPLFHSSAPEEVVSATAHLREWPTKLRLTAAGGDPWGFKRLVLTSFDGESRTVVDSPDGAVYGDNPFWVDASGGAVPAEQEYDVPPEESKWKIFNHYEVLDDSDAEPVDGTDPAAVQRLVERGGYAGFTLSLGQAWLKPLPHGRRFTKHDLQFVGESNPVAFYFHEVGEPRHSRAPLAAGTSPGMGLGLEAGQRAPARLRVSIAKTSGLAASTDPYCVIVLSNAQAVEKEQYKTGSLKTRGAEWSNDIEMHNFVRGDALEFVLMAKDLWSSTVLGTAALTPAQIYPNGFEGTLPVTPVKSGVDDGTGAAALTVKVEVDLGGASRGGLRGGTAVHAVMERDLVDGRHGVLAWGVAWWRDAGMATRLVAAAACALSAASFAIGWRWKAEVFACSRRQGFELLAVAE